MPNPPDLDERVSRLEEEVAALRARVEGRKGGALGYTLSTAVIVLGFVILILLFTG